MSISKRKRALTGSRPSGVPHVGNYLGAFLPAIELSKNYELFFFLADFHTLNVQPSKVQLHDQSITLAATMVALGLDPQEVVFYSQSGSPRVHELAWVLGCVTSYGLMSRAHSFKDAQAKGQDVNMGVFNYPLLMAADILLYDADIVPVGKDQKQHLEMARDMASRFNHQYKTKLLRLPEPRIGEGVGVVSGTDGEKMSSSKSNIISIFASEKQWKKQIMGIVTDSKGVADIKNPDSCPVFKIYSLLSSNEEAEQMRASYLDGNYGYGQAKQELFELVKRTFSSSSDRFFELVKRPDDVRDIIATGSRKAALVADKKIEELYEVLGLIASKS